ncbi:hypothetical protein ASE13_11290 [Sphingomonas sp. Root241]|nr:hypothetical protein ASE13_11290 [Sphingomonas sp. Root241]
MCGTALQVRIEPERVAQLKAYPIDIVAATGASDQRHGCVRYVFRPVGDQQRVGIVAQIVRQAIAQFLA